MKAYIVSYIKYFLVATVAIFISINQAQAGTSTTPICTAEDLELVRSNPSGSFVQTCDIDLTGLEHQAIGTSSAPFSGSYNGDGFVIQGLTIEGTSETKGLFTIINGASLSNITIKDGSISGSSYLGLLAGIAENSTIVNCAASGEVSATSNSGGLVGKLTDSTIVYSSTEVVLNGSSYIGGLVGSLYGASSYVSDSYVTGEISGSSSSGGLIGHVQEGLIERVFVDANVSGSYAAGLIAHFHSIGAPVLRDCYATGHVHGTSDGSSFSPVGGLVAFRHGSYIENCYSNMLVTGAGSEIGGLTGRLGGGDSTNSYWNTDMFPTSSSGEGLSAEEMMNEASFSGWDFKTTWVLDPTLGRPTLQSIPETSACLADVTDDGTVDMADLLQVIINWGPCPGGCAADVTQNNEVEFGDIFAVIAAWGPCS